MSITIAPIAKYLEGRRQKTAATGGSPRKIRMSDQALKNDILKTGIPDDALTRRHRATILEWCGVTGDSIYIGPCYTWLADEMAKRSLDLPGMKKWIKVHGIAPSQPDIVRERLKNIEPTNLGRASVAKLLRWAGVKEGAPKMAGLYLGRVYTRRAFVYSDGVDWWRTRQVQWPSFRQQKDLAYGLTSAVKGVSGPMTVKASGYLHGDRFHALKASGKLSTSVVAPERINGGTVII